MFQRRMKRFVCIGLFVLPAVLAWTASCYSSILTTTQQLQTGAYSKREEIRLHYPDGVVLLDDEWILDYPKIEGRIVESKGEIPREKIAGREGWYRFDVEEADQIEIVKFNRGRTIAFAAGATGGALLILYLIAVTAVSMGGMGTLSCPSVYVHDGTSVELVGSVLAGSMGAPANEEDLLPIAPLRDERIVIEISDHHSERTYLEYVELVHVNRAAGTVVVPSVNGLVAIHELRPVDRAWWNDEDVTRMVAAADNLAWQNPMKSRRRDPRDEINCLLQATSSGDHALVLSLENTLWYEMVLAAYLGQPENLAKASTSLPDSDWAEREGLLLDVLRMDAGGSTTVARIAPRGREGWRTVAIPLGHAEAGEAIHTRLTGARGAWKINKVGLALMSDAEPESVRLHWTVRRCGDGNQRGHAHDDRISLLQGESCSLEFVIPQNLRDGGQWFLAARGRYEVVPQSDWIRLGQLVPVADPTLPNVSLALDGLLAQGPELVRTLDTEAPEPHLPSLKPVPEDIMHLRRDVMSNRDGEASRRRSP